MNYNTYEVRVWKDGIEKWYLNNQLHRENGPAVIYEYGSKYWYRHGRLHREDGPAVIYKNGSKYWYRHGELHREDGPAIESSSGKKFYYLNHVNYSKRDWERQIVKLGNECHNKIVEIEGKQYQLKEI